MMEYRKTYADTFGTTEQQTRQIRTQRSQEAVDHLCRLLQQHHTQGILEVGSGNGGVTTALRSLYPESSITAFDIDDSPFARQAAYDAGASFIAEDVRLVTSEDMQTLITEHHINTIVALRTSSETAIYLSQVLRSVHKHGIFVGSIFNATETPEVRRCLIRAITQVPGSCIVSLLEDPFMPNNELGFVIPYGTK